MTKVICQWSLNGDDDIKRENYVLINNTRK